MKNSICKKQIICKGLSPCPKPTQVTAFYQQAMLKSIYTAYREMQTKASNLIKVYDWPTKMVEANSNFTKLMTPNILKTWKYGAIKFTSKKCDGN